LLKLLKKTYQDFRGGQYLDYDKYCDLTEKLINKPLDYLSRVFFHVLDFNQDGKICEWDLFRTMESMSSANPSQLDLL
jgi:Ca2+-binding EF-hand superfamily protein